MSFSFSGTRSVGSHRFWFPANYKKTRRKESWEFTCIGKIHHLFLFIHFSCFLNFHCSILSIKVRENKKGAKIKEIKVYIYIYFWSNTKLSTLEVFPYTTFQLPLTVLFWYLSCIYLHKGYSQSEPIFRRF